MVYGVVAKVNGCLPVFYISQAKVCSAIVLGLFLATGSKTK